MKNREIFQRDPIVSKLLNDGVATVTEAATSKELKPFAMNWSILFARGCIKTDLYAFLSLT